MHADRGCLQSRKFSKQQQHRKTQLLHHCRYHGTWLKVRRHLLILSWLKMCVIDMVGEVLSHDDENKVFFQFSLIWRMRGALSLAIDSSCDWTDMEQLSVFARLSDGKTFWEELTLTQQQGNESFSGGVFLNSTLSICKIFWWTFQEELICLLPPPGRTTGQIIFEELVQFFEKNGLDVSKIMSIVTNGAPSMAGPHKGLVIC